MNSGKIIIFTCNWNGYSGLETAGKSGSGYSPDIRPVRVSCLGRLHPGIILKAFAHGAAGVMMLGCPPDACHYDFGSHSAEAVFAQSRDLLHLLGIEETRFALDTVSAGDDNAFIEKVDHFIRNCPTLTDSTASSGINGMQR